MATLTGASLASAASTSRNQDVGFAAGTVVILAVLFVPLPPLLIDVGLSLSIALSVLILMVALWIQKPLEFTAFPTILLIATMVRLALNIATTRLVLSNGQDGHLAAGHVIAGFADFVMGGDFVIGIIVFLILITVNFLVITKGASRIAEVGARFSLDAMPGKQMAIDADLASGLINEKEATSRRRELEEESAFFGAMDGASKFVRGDAIAGLIITAINAFGGIIIGVLRHDMSFARALDVYWKLSVGDGLVTQIPALIVSLAAGLLVSKGGARVSANIAVLGQLSRHPRAMLVSGTVMGVLAVAPSLPFLPFALLSGLLIGSAVHGLRRGEQASQLAAAEERNAAANAAEEARNSVKELLRGVEMELRFGKQISGFIMRSSDDLAQRVARIRRKFAKQYGFIIPEIRISDEVSLPPKSYEMLVHGTVVSSGSLRPGDVLVVIGNGPKPSVVGDETNEPAFGLKAMWIPEMYAPVAKREGFAPIDNTSVLLTHLAETLKMNLSHLLSYKDMRGLLDRLEPEYQRLLDEIAPSQISHSTLLAVLKALLAERISIRNLHLILEAVAEVSPFVKKADLIADHVRIRLSAQICGDFAEGGVLKVLRLGARWDHAFYQAIRRDAKGEIVEFDFDPKLIEEFGKQLSKEAQRLTAEGHQFVVVSAAEVRPYVKMAIERLLPTVPVISHAEISRGIQTQFLGTVG